MEIKIVKSVTGFYCETTHKGVHYGQHFSGLSYYEAEAKFQRYVMALLAGRTWAVMNGAY